MTATASASSRIHQGGHHLVGDEHDGLGDQPAVLIPQTSSGAPSRDDLNSTAIGRDIDLHTGSQADRITQLLGQNDAATGIDDTSVRPGYE